MRSVILIFIIGAIATFGFSQSNGDASQPDSTSISPDLHQELSPELSCEAVIHHVDSLREFMADLSDSVWVSEYHALVMCLYGTGKEKLLDQYEDDMKALIKRANGAHFQILDIYYSIAGIHQLTGASVPAIKTLLEGIDFVRKAGLPEHYVGQYYLSVAEIRYAMQDYESSLLALDSADVYVKSDDWLVRTEIHNLKAILAAEYKANFRLSINEFRNAQTAARKISNTESYLNALSNEAFTYSQMGNVDSAEIITAHILKEAIQNENRQWQAISSYYLADYQIKRENFKDALSNAKRAQSMFGTQMDYDHQLQLTHILYLSHKGLGHYKEALSYYEQYETLVDSLSGKETLRQIVELEKDLQFEKEEAALKLAHEKEVAAEKLARNRLTIGLSALGFLLLIGLYFGSRLRKQKIQLEELGRVKDHIFAVIAHDLRAPALAFRGLSKKIKYLVRNKEYDTMDKLGESLEKSTDRLYGITDNLINWAILEMDVLTIKKDVIQVSNMLLDVIALFEPELQRKNIEIHNKINIDQHLICDEESFKIIFRNVLDNALKHTPTNGRIDLQSRDTDGLIKISIRDNGQGIHADQLENIFKLSKEKSQADTEGKKSTGLGLYLIKKLIERNHGSIEIESSIGNGTTVEVALPKVKHMVHTIS